VLAQPLEPLSDVADGRDEDAVSPLLLEQVEVRRLPLGILVAVAEQDRELMRGRSSSAPRASSVKNGLRTSSTMRPMVLLRPARS